MKLIYELCTSVKTGIVLMVLLFVYCSVGSSGVPIHWMLWEPTTWYQLREMPGLEMTEFEWFHWWPFDVLLGLFSLVLIMTTIRRIPFNRINLGVWTIHTGIIVLVIGSVMYFSLKLEGDVPIAQARLTIKVPGLDEPATMLAMPGHSIQVGEGDNTWTFRISSIDPAWELLSGDDKGKRAYSVNIAVLGPEQDQRFIRQVILGYPDYTEDLVNSGDPAQPMARAIKVHGTRTIEPDLDIQIGPDERDVFYLMSTTALWIREVDVTEDGQIVPRTHWVERPLHGMPRFNDQITSSESIWPAGPDAPKVEALDVSAPAVSTNDPLPDVPIIVTDYLRAAQLSTRTEPGGDTLAPALRVSFSNAKGQEQKYELFAMDPTASTPTSSQSLTRLQWIEDESEVTAMQSMEPPRLSVQVPESDVDVEIEIDQLSELDPDTPMQPIAGTPYSIRVVRFDDDLVISGRTLSMARVEIERDGDRWMRWVFDDPNLNGDLPLEPDGGAGAHMTDRRELDTRIRTRYITSSKPPVPILFLAGPDPDQLRLMTSLQPAEPPVLYDLAVGQPIEMLDFKVVPTRYSTYTTTSTKPAVVPRMQRDPGLSNQLSMIRVQVPGSTAGASDGAWLAYHHWPFESKSETLRRFIYQPTPVEMQDGRTVQLMLSRASYPLPTTVSLDGFTVASHIGGFTGDTSSVLNWTSNIRFGTGPDSTTADVSVNNPQERDGFWFFQSQWDPPDRARFTGDVASMGLNYTVLGVGNRIGVWVQLAGGTLMTLGLLYAFYIKPVLIRRRQDEAIETASESTEGEAA